MSRKDRRSQNDFPLLPLTEDERGASLAQYIESIARAYPVLENGAVLPPFPRLFLVTTS
jgi:trans-aconitate 2-methyltransferase